MDYLTEYYKNKCKLLQEKYDSLFTNFKKLMEDNTSRAFGEAGEDIYKILEVGEDATPDEIKKAYRTKALKYHPDTLGDVPEAEKLAAEKEFKKVQQAYDLASDPSGINAQDYKQGRKKYSSSQSAKTNPNPNPSNNTAQQKAASKAKSQTQQQTKQQTPPSEPPVQKPNAEPPVQKQSSAQKTASKPQGSFKAKAGAFGAGLVTGYAADEAARAALSAAGVENETVKNVAGTAANVGVGGATEIAGVGLARGLGAGAAAKLGLRALGPLAAAGAAGQLAGEYIVKPLADIEYKLPGEKGNAKSTIDRYGEALYKGSPIVRGITNLIAGNKLTAGTGDLNTKPTGVAGGDAAKIEQNKREDQEEAEKAANKQKAEEQRTANRSSRIAQKVAELKAQEAAK
jgi:curved DNA-binding protein CbpA